MGKNKVETVRRWRKLNPEKVREYKRLDHLRHREKRNKKDREYYAANRNRILALQKKKRTENHSQAIAKQRARRTANPQKFLEYQREHKRANPAAWRLYSVRKSAKKKGIACTLDRAWIEDRLSAGICEMSGLPFDGGKRTPNSASVDRKDPHGPYTKENCRLILWWLNRALSNLGEEYALEVFRSVLIKRGEIAAYEDRMAA